MEKREDQSQFLANIVKDKKQELNLPVCILGIAFKPETNLKDGSTALLLIEQLKEMNIEVESFDPYINDEEFYYIIFFIFRNICLFSIKENY